VQTINSDCVVMSLSFADKKHSFLICIDTGILENIEIYIHKGGNSTYSQPPASERESRIWKIKIVDEGVLFLCEFF
jgi:hypothetical protein